MPKLKLTKQDLLVNEFYKEKIRGLDSVEFDILVEYLGLSYFTVRGKLNRPNCNFRKEHLELLKKWFSGNGKKEE